MLGTIVLVFLRSLDIKFLSFIIDEYIDIIRGTPVLLQLMIFAFVFMGWQRFTNTLAKSPEPPGAGERGGRGAGEGTGPHLL